MAPIKQEKYTADFIVQKVDEYIANTLAKKEIPILKECCLLNDWSYDYIEKLKRKDEAIGQSIKKLVDRKEVELEKRLYTGAPATGIIFSLKQLGWKDNPQIVNNVTTAEEKPADSIDMGEAIRNLDRETQNKFFEAMDRYEDALAEYDKMIALAKARYKEKTA